MCSYKKAKRKTKLLHFRLTASALPPGGFFYFLFQNYSTKNMNKYKKVNYGFGLTAPFNVRILAFDDLGRG